MIAAEDGNVEEASRRVDEALDKDPDHGEALFLKSKLLLARGETAGALNALLRAAEVMPTNFDAHYNAGVLLLQRQGLEASMEHLFRAYVLRPENELGQLFRDKLLELPIDDPDRSSHFAAIDVDRGDTSTALRWLDKALSSKPDHGPSLFLKGVLVEKAGEAEEAEDLLRRACDAMPGSFDAHQEFGTLLANLDRPAEALPFLEKALKIAERAAGSNPKAAVSLDRLREALDRAREAAR
jgi:tetratricopeptide (TPR) repeat protein